MTGPGDASRVGGSLSSGERDSSGRSEGAGFGQLGSASGHRTPLSWLGVGGAMSDQRTASSPVVRWWTPTIAGAPGSTAAHVLSWLTSSEEAKLLGVGLLLIASVVWG